MSSTASSTTTTGGATPPGRGAFPSLPGAVAGRVVGVDVTRGLAILGMMAVHVFGAVGREGGPTTAQLIAGGRSATTFALVAGLSLAFLTGGRGGLRSGRPGGGRVAAAGIAARGVAIGLLGLMLAYLGSANVILSSYGLMFLLAIPLLWAGPRLLAGIAVCAGLIGPVLVLVAEQSGLAYDGETPDPTLTSLVSEPLGVLGLLLVTGAYPVVVYLAYLSAGLAIGRLDLTSRRLPWRLLIGGVLLAGAAQGLAAYVLSSLGGMSRLLAVVRADEDADEDVEDDTDGGFDAGEATDMLHWDPEPVDSWWYLALPSPHAHTPLDVAHTLGGALALLGLMLLVCRIGVVARLLRPLADIGSMPLTIYSAHLVVLATPFLEEWPRALLLALIVAAAAFAMVWRRLVGQGPLERLLAAVAGSARAAAARRIGQIEPVRADSPAGSPSPRKGPLSTGSRSRTPATSADPPGTAAAPPEDPPSGPGSGR